MQAISDDLEERRPDVADFPVPEAEEREDVGDGLFVSQRTYLDQLQVYKEFQGKANGVVDTRSLTYLSKGFAECLPGG